MSGGTRSLILAIGSCALMSVDAGAARQGSAPSDRGTAWALGYGVDVARHCPRWQVERQEVLAGRGILPEAASDSAIWRSDGLLQRAFCRGQADAQQDRRRHRRFCRDLLAVADTRWRDLAQVIRRVDPSAAALPSD